MNSKNEKLFSYKEVRITLLIVILIIFVPSFGIGENFYVSIPYGIGFLISYFVFKWMYLEMTHLQNYEHKDVRVNFWSYFRFLIKHIILIVLITKLLVDLLNTYVFDPCSNFIHSEKRCVQNQALDEWRDEMKGKYPSYDGPIEIGPFGE